MEPELTRIPDRLRELLESVELEADVTIEGDEDGWTVSVELDHFEQFEPDEEHEAQGRRLRVAVSGTGATPNDAADAARQRLADVLEATPERWSARTPPA
jgi:hypothetical protein